MQRAVRLNEGQLLHLANKSRHENSISGNMHKRSADTGKWQQRWFTLFQNLLFYSDSGSSSRPSGVWFLEGCYTERITGPGKVGESQASSC